MVVTGAVSAMNTAISTAWTDGSPRANELWAMVASTKHQVPSVAPSVGA